MVPATIVAALLFVAAALTAAGVVAGLAGRRIAVLHAAAITSWLARTRWDDPVTLVIGGVVAAAGLVLVLVALVPGRPGVAALNTGRPDVLMGITRRGLRRVAVTAAGDVDGVDRARARARARRVRVKVTTPLRSRTDVTELRAATASAVEDALTRLDLTRPVRVKVRVRRGRQT